MDYTIWTDGGCVDNPNGKGGYGVVILDNSTNIAKEFSEGFLSTTNNRMEVRAIIRALTELPDGASALIYSDSKYAINVIKGEWSRGKNTDLWPIVDAELAKKGYIDFCWVKGHADNENNNRCDELATNAQLKDEADMLVDTGFIPLPKVEKPKKEKKAQKSTINAMSLVIEPMIPDAYITDGCAEAIREFNAKKSPSFGDYQKLKVGGKDFWSHQTLVALEFYFGAYLVSYTKSYFDDDEKSLLSALRWHGRGISIEHAIRKVMVDNEIASNI